MDETSNALLGKNIINCGSNVEDVSTMSHRGVMIKFSVEKHGPKPMYYHLFGIVS